jgi:hypothetical protein
MKRSSIANKPDRSWVLLAAVPILLVGVIFQIYLDWTGFISKRYPEYRKVQDLSARDRAGIFSVVFDEIDVEFFNFLRSTVPEDGILIIPPDSMGGGGRYRFQHLIEYHLFPRRIIACAQFEYASCFKEMEGLSVFILNADGYPGGKWSDHQSSHELIPFTESLGVFVPITP